MATNAQNQAVPDAEDLKDVVRRAFRRLLEKDHFLLTEEASERSVAHHLALHISVLLPEPRLDVDVEFNRMTDAQKGQVRKQLLGLKSGKRSGDVVPDIVVHARPNGDHNALVVEMKWQPDEAWYEQNGARHDRDRAKLQEFTKAKKDGGLGYRLGCFLILAPEKATAEWFQEGVLQGEPECIT